PVPQSDVFLLLCGDFLLLSLIFIGHPGRLAAIVDADNGPTETFNGDQTQEGWQGSHTTQHKIHDIRRSL
ncbi:hypothetical protein CEXT_492691, partial [Caerostris extrusa]